MKTVRHLPFVLLAPLIFASGQPALQGQGIPPGITWYGVLQDGLAEARRTGQPVLLVSAAPQCIGVSGMW